MAIREYNMQVRFTCDGDNQFDTVVQIMAQQAAEIDALLRVLAGPGNPAPVVRLFSDTFHRNITNEEITRKGNSERV